MKIVTNVGPGGHSGTFWHSGSAGSCNNWHGGIENVFLEIEIHILPSSSCVVTMDYINVYYHRFFTIHFLLLVIARPPPSPSNYCVAPQNSQSSSGAAWNLKTSGFCLNCNRVDVWLNSLVTAEHLVFIWSKVTVTWKPSVSLAILEAQQPIFLTTSNIVCTAEWQKRNVGRPSGLAHIWLC